YDSGCPEPPGSIAHGVLLFSLVQGTRRAVTKHCRFRLRDAGRASARRTRSTADYGRGRGSGLNAGGGRGGGRGRAAFGTRVNPRGRRRAYLLAGDGAAGGFEPRGGGLALRAGHGSQALPGRARRLHLGHGRPPARLRFALAPDRVGGERVLELRGQALARRPLRRRERLDLRAELLHLAAGRLPVAVRAPAAIRGP